MTEKHNKPVEERYFLFDTQEITVDDFDAAGYILDIGGGGEGVIGILKGERVIAIDLRKEELEEAADGPLKIIMDARDLQFLDGTFGTATSFFALMYIKSRPDYEQVFREVHRVLKPGGKFLIWDAMVPQRLDDDKDIFVIPISVRVNDTEIETGYGQPWPKEEHDLGFYLDLAEKSGFQVVEQQEQERIFFLQLRKP